MIDIKKEISEEVSKLELENSTDEEILSLPEGSEQLELSDFELRMQKKGWDPAGEKDAQQWLDDGFEIRGLERVGDETVQPPESASDVSGSVAGGHGYGSRGGDRADNDRSPPGIFHSFACAGHS